MEIASEILKTSKPTAPPLKKYAQEELDEILKAHEEWVRSRKHGKQANLSYTDLSGLTIGQDSPYLSEISFKGANLENAILKNKVCRGVDFREANLKNADFEGANFTDTDFTYANLENSNFCEASYSSAIFVGANLKRANFVFADLFDVDFSDADLRGTDFNYAGVDSADVNFADAIIDEITKHLNDQCPRTGSFIGYKKACGCYGDCNRYIVKLEILEDAKRSSATTKKCRCSKAKVLSITNLDGTETNVCQVRSRYDSSFVYTVGEIAEVPDFNKDWWKECTTGIHFFINRESAVNYEWR